MSYGPIKTYDLSIASGATSSSEVDLGRAYSKVLLDLPSATTFTLFVQGATASGGNFKRIYHAPGDNLSDPDAIEIASSIAGANGAIVGIPNYTQYMKLESATAVANGAAYKLICVD